MLLFLMRTVPLCPRNSALPGGPGPLVPFSRARVASTMRNDTLFLQVRLK